MFLLSFLRQVLGLGCHDPIEFRILREVIHEGENDAAIEQQALALTGMGHIGQLMRRDTQLFGKNLPVAASFTFCVMPVGMPPHFLNRFQISTV